MTTLKGWITTTCLVALLMITTGSAEAGTIIAGKDAPAPCTNQPIKEKVDSGVIIAGLTGIIIAGFTGVIIAGVTEQPTENCGVIIAG